MRILVLGGYGLIGMITELEVEAVPPGYPVVHDFVPDLEGFFSRPVTVAALVCVLPPMR